MLISGDVLDVEDLGGVLSGGNKTLTFTDDLVVLILMILMLKLQML